MSETLLDRAFRAMAEAEDGDDAPRLRFYERLADAELFLLLTGEPSGQTIAPQIFDLEEGRFALGFDTEDRLSAFAAGAVPYAALPGRVVARELASAGIGLGFNLGVDASAYLMPAEVLTWLSETLDHRPEAGEARVAEFRRPTQLPQALIIALDAKLAGLAGLARRAHLAATLGVDGGLGHLLAFEDARPGAEEPLAKAISEALTFSGVEAGVLDVAFFASSGPELALMTPVALSFDLPVPEPVRVETLTPPAPGMDPDHPPKLR
ncbi:MAG: SseB family protein [Albidovulum sp.]